MNKKEIQIKKLKQMCDDYDKDIFLKCVERKAENAGKNWEIDNYWFNHYKFLFSLEKKINMPSDIIGCYEYYCWIMKNYHNNKIEILDDLKMNEMRITIFALMSLRFI